MNSTILFLDILKPKYLFSIRVPQKLIFWLEQAFIWFLIFYSNKQEYVLNFRNIQLHCGNDFILYVLFSGFIIIIMTFYWKTIYSEVFYIFSQKWLCYPNPFISWLSWLLSSCNISVFFHTNILYLWKNTLYPVMDFALGNFYAKAKKLLS